MTRLDTLRRRRPIEAFFAVNRVVSGILTAGFGWAVRALFGPNTAGEQTFLSVVVGAAVAGWRSRSVPPLPSRAGSLSIRGSGATLVVDDADGPRWIVRRSDQARPNGGYLIVLPQ